MGRRETDFCSVDRFDPAIGGAASQKTFEIFVAEGFADLEVAAVMNTLQTANDVLSSQFFSWRCVSDQPGYVKSKRGMIIEAEAVFDEVATPHTMIVVGGNHHQSENWMPRMRAMQRKVLPVVLLSEAATQYIQHSKPSGKVTTHWHDATQLLETGHYPELSSRFSEKSNGVITAAGGISTAELLIGLIAPLMDSHQTAELSNRLLLGAVRKSDAEQPKDIASNAGLFDAQITQVLQLMEGAIAEPLAIPELAESVGVSTRQLERAFKATLKVSPAKFYKKLRAKRARVMIEETLMPLIEVAVATGFGSNNTLSKTIRDEYGISPAKMRERKSMVFLRFETT